MKTRKLSSISRLGLQHQKKKERQKEISGVCCSSILHVYECVFCSISHLFVYLRVHMPSSSRSSQCGSALGPGASRLPFNFTPLVCVSTILGGLAAWQHNHNQKKYIQDAHVACL